MERSKISVNSIINFCCIVLFSTIIICYLSTFWKFGGQVGSIHNLIGFPSENLSLQEYIAKNTKNTAFIEESYLKSMANGVDINSLVTKSGVSRILNFNSFVYAPVVVILSSLAGVIYFSLRIKSENTWIYNILYGAVGIFTFCYIDFLRLGTTWKFQVIVFSIIAAAGIAQGIMKFFVKKDLEINGNPASITKFVIVILWIAAYVFTSLFITSNVSLKKTNYELTEANKYLSVSDLIEQIEKEKVTDKGIIAAKDVMAQITMGSIDIPDEYKEEYVGYLSEVIRGEIQPESKEKLIEFLQLLDENDIVKIFGIKYTAIEGADQTWVKGSKEGLTIVSSAPFDEFDKVEINDEAIDRTKFDPERADAPATTGENGETVMGSYTKIILLPEYLETLPEGEYQVRIASIEGSLFTTFTVSKRGGG